MYGKRGEKGVDDYHEECCDRSAQRLGDVAPAWCSGHLRAATFSVLQLVAATQARSLDLS